MTEKFEAYGETWLENISETQPVPDDVVVCVLYRDGLIDVTSAGEFIWTHSGEEDDIIGYQLS